MIVRSGMAGRHAVVAALAAVLVVPAAPASAAPAAPHGGAAAAPQVAAAAPPSWRAAVRSHALRYVGAGQGPAGPDPRLAMVPRPGRIDWGGWRLRWAQPAPAAAVRARAQAAARLRAAARAAAQPLLVREDEPGGTRGANDTFGTAQRVDGVGTGAGENPAALVLGRLSPAPISPSGVVTIRPSLEPDDDLRSARDTGVSRTRQGFSTTGVIGERGRPDDVDLYKVTLAAGQILHVGMRRTGGPLYPTMALVDAQGSLVAFSEDTGTTSTLDAPVRTAGAYFVVATGYTSFDPATGGFTPPRGDYRITAAARAGDRDLFALDLRAGDVLGVSVKDAAGYVSVFDQSGTEVHGSPYDASYVYPLQSPLPGGGVAATDHVVRTSGLHYVEVSAGAGAYEATVEVYRPGGVGRARTQTIFLDTDGQRLNTGVFGGRGVTTLSPLRAFLGQWGLTREQERALVDRIKLTVQENVVADLEAAGLSDSVDVRVVSSFDGPDPFGRPGVTRVVVGGTIQESGVPTIGIAQSIDPGNFAREETALVLLDSLSEPAGASYSLNTYIRPGARRLTFVGQAIGNVVAHEVGHLIGSWHVDETNTRANLMDAGGNFALLFGVGPDRIGGNADDPDVDFGADGFNLFEGFTGTEDTLSRSTWGMSRGRLPT